MCDHCRCDDVKNSSSCCKHSYACDEEEDEAGFTMGSILRQVYRAHAPHPVLTAPPTHTRCVPAPDCVHSLRACTTLCCQVWFVFIVMGVITAIIWRRPAPNCHPLRQPPLLCVLRALHLLPHHTTTFRRWQAAAPTPDADGAPSSGGAAACGERPQGRGGPVSLTGPLVCARADAAGTGLLCTSCFGRRCAGSGWVALCSTPR